MRFGHANPLCNGFSPAIEALKHRRIMEGKLAHDSTHSLPDTFFVLNGDMELNRNWKFFI